MPCFSPLQGYRSVHVNPSGKRSIVFDIKQGFSDLPVEVPCGQCIGCRLEYSRQWAVRCVHESQMHKNNSFITLTYNDEHLPKDHSISKYEFQKFIKRLRKEICRVHGKDTLIRFFGCGEYGDKKGRPHYHAIIFGFDFPDRKVVSESGSGFILYTSELLEKSWNKGYVTVGEATFESAAYVARYITKKHKGKDSPLFYELIDPDTGELHLQEKEFCAMSRMPGIGKEWLVKFGSDTDKDFITVRGQKMSLPTYYDRIIESYDEHAMIHRKDDRRRKASQHKEDNTPERLRVRETVKLSQIDFLKRNYEGTT